MSKRIDMIDGCVDCSHVVMVSKNRTGDKRDDIHKACCIARKRCPLNDIPDWCPLPKAPDEKTDKRSDEICGCIDCSHTIMVSLDGTKNNTTMGCLETRKECSKDGIPDWCPLPKASEKVAQGKQ